jgi:hypothetical protein
VIVQTLAAEVASYLGLELGKIKIKRFADGEIYVQVQVCGSIARCIATNTDRQASLCVPVCGWTASAVLIASNGAKVATWLFSLLF